MGDSLDMIVDVVHALRGDEQLRECFTRILRMGSCTQQVRVFTLQQELEKRQAPQKIMDFLRVLGDEKIAHLVLQELEKS